MVVNYSSTPRSPLCRARVAPLGRSSSTSRNRDAEACVSEARTRCSGATGTWVYSLIYSSLSECVGQRHHKSSHVPLLPATKNLANTFAALCQPRERCRVLSAYPQHLPRCLMFAAGTPLSSFSLLSSCTPLSSKSMVRYRCPDSSDDTPSSPAASVSLLFY